MRRGRLIPNINVFSSRLNGPALIVLPSVRREIVPTRAPATAKPLSSKMLRVRVTTHVLSVGWWSEKAAAAVSDKVDVIS